MVVVVVVKEEKNNRNLLRVAAAMVVVVRKARKKENCSGGGGGGVVLFVLFYILRAKKLLILTVFILFLFLDKIQDGGHVWWRHRSPAAPPAVKNTSSCREDQRRSTEGKIVSKDCNLSKTQGGSITPLPPPPPCTTVGAWLRVRPRVNMQHLRAKNQWSGTETIERRSRYVTSPW